MTIMNAKNSSHMKYEIGWKLLHVLGFYGQYNHPNVSKFTPMLELM